MPWILFGQYGWRFYFDMVEQRELELDLNRWDGESPAYRQETL